MRHGRAKQTRKALQFYERMIPNFPRTLSSSSSLFSSSTNTKQQPYNILLDGTFIVTAMKYHIPFIERIYRLLGIHHTYEYISSNNDTNNMSDNNKNDNHNDKNDYHNHDSYNKKMMIHKQHKSHNNNSNSNYIKPKLQFFICESTITELQSLLVSLQQQQQLVNDKPKTKKKKKNNNPEQDDIDDDDDIIKMKYLQDAIDFCLSSSSSSSSSTYNIVILPSLLANNTTNSTNSTDSNKNHNNNSHPYHSEHKKQLSIAATDIWNHIKIVQQQHSQRSTTGSSNVNDTTTNATTGSTETPTENPYNYYMIATQDPTLLYYCRNYHKYLQEQYETQDNITTNHQQSNNSSSSPSFTYYPIPIIHFTIPKSGCVLILDPPSTLSLNIYKNQEHMKWFTTTTATTATTATNTTNMTNTTNPTNTTVMNTTNTINTTSNYSKNHKHDDVAHKNTSTVPIKKRRIVKKAKGPNPLSCKKKKLK